MRQFYLLPTLTRNHNGTPLFIFGYRRILLNGDADMFGLNNPFFFFSLWLVFCLIAAVVLAFNKATLWLVLAFVVVGLLPISLASWLLLKTMTSI